MTTGEGLIEQIERSKTETTYLKLSKKILQDTIEQIKNKIKNNPPSKEWIVLFNPFTNLCFKLRYVIYPDYKYTIKYHKRIKLYEFRFYKKYKQNVEFREYYNEKYEKMI